jgi:microcystin degradation protein MlrC
MNYRLTFAPLAAGCYILDTPGPTPASLKHVRFQKLTRPYFPADAEIEALAPTVLT